MTRSQRGDAELPPGPARDLVDLLRRLRQRRRLSVGQIAVGAGLSASHVSEVLRGWKTPSPQAAAAIARALGASEAETGKARQWAGHAHDLRSYQRTHSLPNPAPAKAPLVTDPGRPEQSARLPAGQEALIGRDYELALLAGLIEEAAAGRGGAVLIEGEPGIGKSALVRGALARARKFGGQVFWGAGDELGQMLPLVPFLDALRVQEPSADPRRNTIAGLLRGEVATDRGTDVSATLVEQLRALVAGQCAQQPVVLVIDDLQWADQASIALWGRLARTARQAPLLLVGMMRPVPQRHDLLVLRRVVGDEARLQLAGLTGPAVADLVTVLAGGKPGDDLLRLADGAAGNPLYLVELVAALARSSGLTVTDAGAATLATGYAPGSLSAAIANRLDFVTGPVRDMLRGAALLGVDFALPDLAIVLGRGIAELIPAVDEACAAGVLTESAGGLEFRHPLIWAALYDGMLAPVRAAWHRDAGRALAVAGAPADRVARQLLQATSGPDDPAGPMDRWMLDWLVRTAALLVGQAPGVAAELLTRAISCPVGSTQRDGLVSRLADALYRVGDTAGAEQVIGRALEYATDPDLLLDLHWTLAQCRIRAGASAESLAALDRALALPVLSARHQARLLVLAARTRCNLGEIEKAGQIAASALAAATEAGDNWAIGWALHVQSLVTSAQSKMTDTLRLIDRALTVTRADPALTDLRLLLQINKAVTLGDMDDYTEALAVARQARQLAHQAGTVVRLAQAHGALGQLLFENGRWDEALTEAGALNEDLKEPTGACCDLGIAAVISFHRGEVAAARRYLAAATSHAERIGRRLVSSLALARSLDHEIDGAQREALAELTAGLGGNYEELEEIEDLLPDAVRLAAELGDQATAQTLARHATALAAGAQVPHRQASALYCRSLLEQDPAGLLTAAGLYEQAGRPLPQARALEAAAGYFVKAGDRIQARPAFTRAVEVYGSMDAAVDIARLRTAIDTISSLA